jgi:dGTPase
MTKELREFLYKNLYFHPELAKLNEFSFQRMELLFKSYLADQSLLGGTAHARVSFDGVQRAAADYIAGMTDRFAQNEYDALKRGDGVAHAP